MPINKHLFVVLFSTILLSFSPVFGQLIPSSRISDWAQPGMQDQFIPVQVVDISSYNPDTSGIMAADSALAHALADSFGPRKIIFPRGTYLFQATLILPDSVLLEGEADPMTGKSLTNFRFSPGMDKHGILLKGDEISLNLSPIGPLEQGMACISIPNSSLQPGDYIRLFPMDDSLFVTNYAWAANCTGQIMHVLSVTGDSVRFDKPLRRTYDPTKLPVVYKVLPRKQVHISCINMERMDPTTYQTSNVFCDLAVACSVSGVESFMCNFGHVTIQRSSRITVKNNYFHDAFDYGDGGVGYGVVLQSTAGDCFIYANRFNHLRHSMLLQSGANGNVLAYNYATNPYWVSGVLPSNSAGDIVLHGNYPYMNLFEGNVVQNIVIDNSHGINGPYNTFFRNRAELYGIFMNTSPASSSQNFIGNQVTNTSSFFYGLYTLQGTNHYEYGNTVKGSLTPASTAEYPDSTLFNYSFSDFYRYYASVPPIHLTNWQSNIPFNEVEYRSEVFGYNSICADRVYENPYAGIEKSSIPALIVYPNPTSQYIYVNADNVLGISVYDAMGRLCLTTNCCTVDMNSLSSGMYTLKVEIGSTSHMRRVIFQAP